MSLSTDFCLISSQLVSLIISISIFLKTSESSSPEPIIRILGGKDCQTDDQPFVISLQTSDLSQHFCGGSLIHPRWVLTAGHCTTRKEPDQIKAVAGASRLGHRNLPETSQTRYVERIVIHPNFNPYSLYCDVSLIYLAAKFNLNDHVNLIELPKVGFTKNCTVGMVLGWGRQKLTQTYSQDNHLRCLNLPVIDENTCSILFGEKFDSGAICTVSEKAGKDACFGDSGGPLVCGNKVIGIVSKGRSCGLPYVPGIYARTEHFLDFINETMMYSTETSTAVKRKPGKMEGIVGNVMFLIGLHVISAILLL